MQTMEAPPAIYPALTIMAPKRQNSAEFVIVFLLCLILKVKKSALFPFGVLYLISINIKVKVYYVLGLLWWLRR